jgi:transcriptional regulator with XRE-family HTH domain
MPLDTKSGPEQFKDWMKRRGFNQSETAEFFGWGENVISQFVNGRRSPGLARAIKIEELTGIPVEAWASSADDESETPVSVGRAKGQSSPDGN